jgi:hypothetical protein
VASNSLFEQARDLTSQVSTIISSYDIDSLGSTERELLVAIKRRIGDTRLDVRDYEYAETRAEQLVHAAEAQKRLMALQRDILKASEYGLFSAIDVAQLTAKAESIIEQLS